MLAIRLSCSAEWRSRRRLSPAAPAAPTRSCSACSTASRRARRAAEVARLLSSGEARGSFKSLALTHAADARWLLVGLGKRDDFTAERARVAAAVARDRARELSTESLCWELPADSASETSPRRSSRARSSPTTASSATSPSRRRIADAPPTSLTRLIVSSGEDLTEAVAEAALVAEAVNAARDLQNRPGNDLTPTALADYAQALARDVDGLSVEVEGREEIVARGMGAFAAVAQGSDQEPALITLRYEGAGASGPLLGFVGKAVTFDSGGISLKPGAKMAEMKFDMSGGAAVIEAVAAIARLQLPVKLVAVVGATENLPSGHAVKPGDIVTASNGKTIEVNNTDAEGRLVLADCLCHAVGEGAERIVDLATLTGAVIVALGSTYAGLMGNDDALRRADRRGRRAHRRDRLAPAAARRVRRADQGHLRRPRQRARSAQGRHDRRRLVPLELRRRRALGAPGHRRLGVGTRPRLRAARAHPAMACACWSSSPARSAASRSAAAGRRGFGGLHSRRASDRRPSPRRADR